MVTIRTRGLSFEYPGASVLEDVDLDIDGAQLVSILGPNGVGKSTSMHCLNKILAPTAGTVLINGEDIGTLSLKESARTAYRNSTTSPTSMASERTRMY